MNRCSNCTQQESSSRLARPHDGLQKVRSTNELNGTRVSFLVTIFVCRMCGAILEHVDDERRQDEFWRVKEFF